MNFSSARGNSAKKKILFLTPSLSGLQRSGGMEVTFDRLRGLSTVADVTVLTTSVDQNAKREFPAVVWETAGSVRNRSYLALLSSYVKRLPLSIYRNSSEQLLQKASELNEKYHWDLVYVDHWLMIEAGNFIKAFGKKVLHLHNAEPELFFSITVKEYGILRKVAAHLEGLRSVNYLIKNISQFDELHLLSSADKKSLESRKIKINECKIFLPSGAEPQKHVLGIEKPEQQVLFVGTLTWAPNLEGIKWYCDKIQPQLPKGLKTIVIGKGATPEFQKNVLKLRNFSYLDYIDDLEPFYNTSLCLIAPLKSGSGIKMKIVNAIARGLPVVTTKSGVEGFPAGYDGAIFVANAPLDFVKYLKLLAEDSDVQLQARQIAKRYYEENFTGIAWTKWLAQI